MPSSTRNRRRSETARPGAVRPEAVSSDRRQEGGLVDELSTNCPTLQQCRMICHFERVRWPHVTLPIDIERLSGSAEGRRRLRGFFLAARRDSYARCGAFFNPHGVLLVR